MSQRTSFWFSAKGLAAVGFIGAVSYFLLVEHREHLYQWLPYLILALCPLMHLFMHRGHGGHGAHKSKEPETEAYRRGYEEGKKQSDQHRH